MSKYLVFYICKTGSDVLNDSFEYEHFGVDDLTLTDPNLLSEATKHLGSLPIPTGGVVGLQLTDLKIIDI